jgi:hypothetical protein
MSNFLAIATVTAVLRDLLQEGVGTDVPVVRVTTARPDDTISGTPETRVNIYLYQVTPNAGWRNADVPTRRADGTVVQRPQVALDLHYMISFYGDESQLMSQRMLGSVVRTLHARPILTRDLIRNTISSGVSSGSFPFLQNSNLADEVELVKFSPLHLSLEEQSKIWSVFFQIPYVLSVAYQGTVVLIEGDETPQSALPVRSRSIYVVPFRQPIIDQVISRDGAELPITVDSTISIVGKSLKSANSLVRFGDTDVPPALKDVADTLISLPLSAVDSALQSSGTRLQAGIQGLQVVQPRAMGTPPVPHEGVQSGVSPFVLHPVIAPNTSTGAYDISTTPIQLAGEPPGVGVLVRNIQPAIGKDQRVMLMLNEVNPNPGQPLRPPGRLPLAYTFQSPSRDQPGTNPAPDTSDSITIPILNVVPGTYLVRLQVDGAESLLVSNTDGLYTAPQVTIS